MHASAVSAYASGAAPVCSCVLSVLLWLKWYKASGGLGLSFFSWGGGVPAMMNVANSNCVCVCVCV